jgi:LDH2 family malate/lactate/ureidoglycolate dehydrogenase
MAPPTSSANSAPSGTRTTGGSADDVELPIAEARQLAIDVLRAHRLSEEDAEITADHLVDAQLTGYLFAGLPRLLVVLDRLRKQPERPAPVEVVRETPVSATLAGHGNLGYVVCRRAVDLAIDKAEDAGIAVVGAHDSYYSGRSGYYTERAARRGFVAIHGSSAFPMVVPSGGRRPVLGSNPISFAFPRPAEPLVIDLSTASSTWGALQLAQRVGEALPEGVAVDEAGVPTTDPSAALLGGILPSAGHKGYAIATAVQALGVLSGGDAVPAPFGDFGFFFVLMRRDLLVDAEQYDAQIDELVRVIQDSPPVEGTERVRLPGEGSAARRAEALARGTITIPKNAYDEIVALLDGELPASSNH